MCEIDHLAEISDDPDDEDSDYGRGWQDGYRAGQAATPGRPRRLNGPMVARLRACAADTSPNWDGAVTVYPPEARDLVALIDDVLAATTPDGPRRWALPDDAEVEEQWGACYPGEPVARAKDREGALIFVESLSAYAESRDDAKRAILVKRQAVTTPWEPADATPAADGQDGDGRDG